MTEPAIAILPYGGRLGPKLASRPLDDLDWPMGRPARLAQGTVADLTAQDHLIVYPKTAMHYQPRFGIAARVSMMLVEPSIIHGRHLKLLRWTHRRFFRVLSYNEALLADIPNGLFLPYGTTWVPDHATLDTTKSKGVSLIASAKRDQVGHVLRHDLVERIKAQELDVDILGRGYAPFANKSDGLAPYRYSVVIENVRERNYFTEKLMDALLCDTVPIYWGCPNIGDFVEDSGLMICTSASEVLAAIAQTSQADYDTRQGALQAAKAQAVQWIDLHRRAAETLAASL
ncbi:glycosyltransferase family 10 domain-containing protein [Sulfitobacter sabulilitoris]|uniref:Fucosyltransferase C-terminal domain-containing protein n=1 Tax=Sulfitobacter sabulilitoris TaxID=2562655 RepID=A0A5S3PLZ2_9RHOB|nr:glycosyltransferase family 10 [Sulfitobacter sabulilitoris]TMM55444.1 hypothetical protein FDT80_07805 [Sulfitobacter sabulilitoris]